MTKKKNLTEVPPLFATGLDPEQKVGSASTKKIQKTTERKPATSVMKAVAERTMDRKRMQKDFTKEEIEDIIFKRQEGDELTKAETRALRERYRNMKRWVLEKEKTNRNQIICVPCIMDGKGFYKLFEVSALYYVYRLADRMQRTANLRSDTDDFLKAVHTASITNIGKFAEQMKQLENPMLEITEDGIYVFTLKKMLTDDDIAELRRVEQERRDRLHNMIKPQAMDPATFQGILMIVRQVAPKVRKLDRQDYYMYGEDMLRDLSGMINVYFDYAGGLLERETTGKKLLSMTNHLLAGLAILSETGTWEFGAAANVGENINELIRLVKKDFGLNRK